jgi:hypothetical protein
MTPRSEALAFRIWAYCEPRGWDVTSPEIAEALGEPMPRVRLVCAMKGWTIRLRASQRHDMDRFLSAGQDIMERLL